MFRLLSLFFFVATLPVYAQVLPEKHNTLRIKHTTDFEITGSDSLEVWQSTSWIPLVNRKGNADYITKVKLLYSDTGLYFLFSCDDQKITATLNEDFTNLFNEDVVEIFLWPDETLPLYFEYELSPLNHELAILITNLDGKTAGWKPWHYEGKKVTRHATTVLKDENKKINSWMAEIFIPFALLQPLGNVPPKKGTQWRVNLYRIDYDNDATYYSWQSFRRNFHDYEMFGVLQFE